MVEVKEAPGPDGIPNVALKTEIHGFRAYSRWCCRNVWTKVASPNSWEIQKLVLLSKSGKRSEDAASFRPICLLDTFMELLERIILNVLSGK